MGAWGHGLFESDRALDIRDTFIDKLKESEYAHQAVVELEQVYADEMAEVEVATVVAYMAIGFGGLTKEIKEKALLAIANELKNGLHDWDDPGKRRDELIAFSTYLQATDSVTLFNLDNN